MEGDPFGFIANQCRPTSSQEHRLRTCPFARESELFSDDDDDEPSPGSMGPTETPVEPTGIVMVSLSDSSNDDSTPHEDFQTPPEESLLASSEEQRPIEAVDVDTSQRIDGGDVGETLPIDEIADLGKDLDNLGFSGVKLTQVIDGGDRVSGVDFSSGADEIGTSTVSEFGLKKFKNLESEAYESLAKRRKTCGKNMGLEFPDNILGNTEPMMVETNRYENGDTEVLELESEKTCEVMGLSEDSVFVEMPLKETSEILKLNKSDKVQKNGEGGSASEDIEDIEKFKSISSSGFNRLCEDGSAGKSIDDLEKLKYVSWSGVNRHCEGGSASKNIDDLEKFRYASSSGVNRDAEDSSANKNIDDLEKFKYVSSSKNIDGGKGEGVKGKRELPASIIGQVRNVAVELGADNLSAKGHLLKNLLDALKMVAGEFDGVSEDVDFLETAKRKGMDFPRPRWWLPEGFGD